ncbi:MAG: helix-turn-helix domain-containing protein [Oscillospiraceae bacterium]|nr:helix-turn-helix domain-containing protein [Oscillospiraceae bacterium]
MESTVIMLNAQQREALVAFTKKGVHSVRLVNRARVILALDRNGKKDHLRITRISDQVGLSRQAIYDIRDDFLASETIESFLTRKKRETPPVPPKVTGEVEAQIIAIACSEPPEGYARWTVRLISGRTAELGIANGIGKSAVGDVLKKHNLSLT